MKRRYTLCLLCLVCFLLASCGTAQNTSDTIVTASSPVDPIPETVPTVSSSAGIDDDYFAGEYNDLDCDQPNLEIKKIEDGTYEIEIGIFRLYHINCCIGKRVDNKIEFTSDQIEGEELKGTITVNDEIATVSFLSECWNDIGSENTYQYYKTSDIPYDHMYEY